MLSQRIRLSRKRKKLTQEELAQLVKTTKGTISNYENGHSAPHGEMLSLLADTLDTTTDYLLGRTNSPDPHQEPEEDDINIAYFGGAKETLTEEEAARLKEELEMFRAFKEKRLREKRQK